LFYKFHPSHRLQFPFLLSSSSLLSFISSLCIKISRFFPFPFTCSIGFSSSFRSKSMLAINSEIFLSGFMITSTLRRSTHLVQSFSVVFLYWFYVSPCSMASPGGTSSGSSLLQTSGSEEDLQALMDQKRQKRMISNRESARRSRMRKQKHLDDLTAQLNQLRKENSRILTSLTLTTRHHSAVEAENSVLRTQMVELGNRLQSLSEIL
ncbi:unnamed protein product, partial [Musa acuminata subsp. burmannicoides]